MSESLDGRDVIATRQNAGRSAIAFPRPARAPGCWNVPAARAWTLSIVASGSVSDFRLSHVAAPDSDGIAIATAASVIARNMVLPPRRYCYPEAACSGYSE